MTTTDNRALLHDLKAMSGGSWDELAMELEDYGGIFGPDQDDLVGMAWALYDEEEDV